MQVCPKCRHQNPHGAVVCEKCHYLLTAPPPTGTNSSNTEPTGTDTPTRSRPAMPAKTAKMRSWKPWLVASAVLLALVPVAYGLGYLGAYGQLGQALHEIDPNALITHNGIQPVTVTKTRVIVKKVPVPTPSSTSPTPTQTSTSPTPVTSSPAPASSSPNQSANSLPPGFYEINGTVQNGELVTTVWMGPTPFHMYPVRMMVDTGAVHTMINAPFALAAGCTNEGNPETFAGIGGNETVDQYGPINVYPKRVGEPDSGLLYMQTEPGGLGRTAVGQSGVMILLGQNVIDTGTLTQNGDTWTFVYPGQGPYAQN